LFHVPDILPEKFVLQYFVMEIKIFTDGGSRGNPGPSACAFTVLIDNKIAYQFAKKLGVATNNIAEYQGVIEALKYLKQNPEIFKNITGINFFADSLLIVNQLNGKFKIKNKNLMDLVFIAKQLEKEITPKIVYNAVSRPLNAITDALVNEILDNFHEAFIEKKF
jgi:ribonuclease HI